jgi:serine/threonine protein kinase
MPMLKAAAQLGQWTVVRYIDKGGNGEVYKVTGPDGPSALKIIADRTAESVRYRRFRREIETVLGLGERPGVLPVLDSHLPEQPSKRDRAWYVMPLATPLAEQLDGKPVADAVQAVAQLAQTLGDLHALGIGHRDLKPGNLYWRNARPALGDFGLAAIPQGESLTEPGRVPAAFGYIADEMIMHPETADPLSADVFALAKVLWKLLVPSTDYPPQGPLRADAGPATLARHLTVPRADSLDRILEAATAPVASRIHMATMAAELRAWLELRPPAGLPDELDAAVLAARRSMDSTLQAREAKDTRERSTEAVAEHLRDAAVDLFERVASIDPAGAEIGRFAIGLRRQWIEQQPYLGRAAWGEPFHQGVRVTRGPEHYEETLVVAFCLQVDESGVGAIDGVLAVGHENESGNPAHHLGTRTAPLGVKLEAEIDRIVDDAAQALPAVLERFARRGS